MPQRVDLDVDALLDMAYEKGLTKKEMAQEFGISPTTLSKRIADIQKQEGLLLQYRGIQNLQLTSLQAKILENITDDKIEQASLMELVSAFKILKDKELVDTGRPNEIKGLVGYLVQMEKEKIHLEKPVDVEAEDVEVEEVKDLNNPDYIPDL
jgi:hypothetical protein